MSKRDRLDQYRPNFMITVCMEIFFHAVCKKVRLTFKADNDVQWLK